MFCAEAMVLAADILSVSSKARQILLLVLVFGLSVLAFRPSAAEVFQDWELVCNSQNSENTCRLQQAQAVNGGKDVVFLFNVISQGKANVGLISTPLEVYLPAGISLRVDKGKTRQAAFETCNLSGCHAGFQLDAQLLSALKSGAVLTATLMDTKSTKIDVAVSLKGFSAGLNALSEQKAKQP